MTIKPRYQGRLLLRLLECYVLWAIGRLEPEDAAQLELTAPHLARAYKTTGTWQEIVAAAMEFPPNMADLMRDSWRKTSAVAEARGKVLEPQAFAEIFCDQNFLREPEAGEG